MNEELKIIPISILSTYKNKQGERLPLPTRLAFMAEDAAEALPILTSAVESEGGNLYLSDCYRSFEQQYQAHLDYVNKKKTAYSPYPGGSFHQAGRALDLDLDALKMTLKKFWDLAIPLGWTPIIDKPDSKEKEAWHFEFRGIFQKVRDKFGYSQSAKCAICDINGRVHDNDSTNYICHLQWELLRLGYDLGSKPVDGVIGKGSRLALEDAKQKYNIPGDLDNLPISSVIASLREAAPESTFYA